MLSVCYSNSSIQRHMDLDLCSDCNAHHLCDLGQETCSQSLPVSVWRIRVAATSFRISRWHCNVSCSSDDQVDKTWRNAKWQKLRRESQDNGGLPSNKYVMAEWIYTDLHYFAPSSFHSPSLWKQQLDFLLGELTTSSPAPYRGNKIQFESGAEGHRNQEGWCLIILIKVPKGS